MNRICVQGLMGLFLFFLLSTANAQTNAPMTMQSIATMDISISPELTVNLIFPYAIKSVDRGTKDVLVQKARNVENILQVKSAGNAQLKTNLTVVTADGALYSFALREEKQPSRINIQVGNTSVPGDALAIFSTPSDWESKIKDAAEQIALKQPRIKHLSHFANQIELRLNGIYIAEDRLFFQFHLKNNGNIHYDIRQLRFFIRDKKVGKRTAAQEQEVVPIYMNGNAQIIRGKSEQTVVVVLPKFTIPDKKIMYVQLQEDHGGRHLQMSVANKQLLKAAIFQ